MDDAPRARIFKTATIVGLLVLMGAGCAKSSENQKSAAEAVATAPDCQNLTSRESASWDKCQDILQGQLVGLPSVKTELQKGLEFDSAYTSSTPAGETIYFILRDSGLQSTLPRVVPTIVPQPDTWHSVFQLGFFIRGRNDANLSPVIGIQDHVHEIAVIHARIVSPRLVLDRSGNYQMQAIGVGVVQKNSRGPFSWPNMYPWKIGLKFNPVTKHVTTCGFTRAGNGSEFKDFMYGNSLEYPKSCN